MKNPITSRKITRRNFLKLGLGFLVNATILSGGGLAYGSQVEPAWEELTTPELVLPRLDLVFDGYKIAQISDIHIGTWMTEERLSEISNRINDQKPDLVVITGDFVHHNPGNYYNALVNPLRQLNPPDGVLAVLGNHDHWTNPDLVREILFEAGILDIGNQVQTVERAGNQLHIAGLDDYWERQDRLDLVLGALPEVGAAILLVHEPDFADQSAATGRFDLQLSGHSHGGQVILPFSGPPVLPFLGEKYPLGLYQVGSMYQYTNRGIGMTNPAVRFNCRPEISLLTLRSP